MSEYRCLAPRKNICTHSLEHTRTHTHAALRLHLSPGLTFHTHLLLRSDSRNCLGSHFLSHTHVHTHSLQTWWPQDYYAIPWRD